MEQLIPPLSQKRNSKRFDRRVTAAAISLHDNQQIGWRFLQFNIDDGLSAHGFGADDDQRRGRNVSLSGLLKMVR
jgi:hypothetical protein